MDKLQLGAGSLSIDNGKRALFSIQRAQYYTERAVDSVKTDHFEDTDKA